MSRLFPLLFSPFALGSLKLRNRVFSTGHMTCMLSAGLPNEDFVAYHEARARGGAGLIITESTATHVTSSVYNIRGYDDACIPAFARVAEAVHAHGCAIFGQLGHGGRESHASNDGSRRVAYGPSALPTERFHNMPREMPAPMIPDIVRGFGATARRMQQAGYDGVEIMASHALLLAQFLNPRSNLRGDAYGGALDNRLRLVREVIAAVRESTSGDMAVGIRISGDEMNHDGLEADEVLEICRCLGADGGLDFIDVIAGSMTGIAGAVHIVPPMNVEPGYVAPLAARIRAAVPCAVFVAGRINQPHVAERILAAGEADLCGMTRAQICDPQMVAKAAEDRIEDIRACIGCNQACIGHMHNGFPISCIQHPETGRERRYGQRVPAAESRRVLVAGGGPAGMKAAAVAAERGHRVLLCEAAARLGGQTLLAQALPGRAEFGGIVGNLEREMTRAGVVVRRRTRVTPELVAEEKPDVVIVATGAQPFRPDLPGAEEAHVVDAWAVLSGEANVGSRVVIADWRCDWVGLGLAEKLARDGCHVRLAVHGYMPGQMLQSYVRDRWVGDLHRLGVEMVPWVRVFGADADSVYFQHIASGEPVVLEQVDTLVLAQGQMPDTALEQALEGAGVRLLLAGDCLSPRTCEEAVLEGLEAGCMA